MDDHIHLRGHVADDRLARFSFEIDLDRLLAAVAAGEQ